MCPSPSVSVEPLLSPVCPNGRPGAVRVPTALHPHVSFPATTQLIECLFHWRFSFLLHYPAIRMRDLSPVQWRGGVAFRAGARCLFPQEDVSRTTCTSSWGKRNKTKGGIASAKSETCCDRAAGDSRQQLRPDSHKCSEGQHLVATRSGLAAKEIPPPPPPAQSDQRG